MPLASGDKLGPYEILAPIGKGGMGEVYRARDTRLGREVAVKVSQSRFNERFEREARVISSINHPNICTLHDVGPDYLVMELAEGETLAERIKHGPIPLPKAIEYAAQMADGLAAAHSKGVVHRDLKPGNVILTKTGVKILDFGLAKVGPGPAEPPADATETTPLTDEGSILGTLQYMSPEQVEGREADARSDIFAFGLILYEMITGNRAFQGRSQASLIASILKDQPRPMHELQPVTPRSVERVVQTCLEKDPDDRFQSARDLKRALDWIDLDEPSGVSSGIHRGAAPAPASRKWLGIAAALAIVAALGGWVAASFRQPAPPERLLRFQINPPAGGRFVLSGNANVGGMEVSPDGRYLAFVATVGTSTSLWLQRLDQGAAQPVPGSESAAYPFWSPDSRSVGFIARGRLWRADVGGGAPAAICDIGRGGFGASWLTDGRIVFSSQSALFEVGASGGEPARFAEPDDADGRSHFFPHALPGGDFLYTTAVGGQPRSAEIFIDNLNGPSNKTQILNGASDAVYSQGYLLWLRGATLVAQRLDLDNRRMTGDVFTIADGVTTQAPSGKMNVSVSESGLLVFDASAPREQFVWFDLAGKQLEAASEERVWGNFRLSPDGRRIAATAGTDLALIDAERGLSSPYVGSQILLSPIWSPDGRTLVLSAGGLPFNLYKRDGSGGGELKRLTTSPDIQFATDWSRDGRTLIYYEIAADTQRDLWTMPIEPDGNLPGDGAQPQPYLRTQFNESWPRFSPEENPRWVAYQSDESGRFEVYVDSFPEPRNRVRISTAGGSYPQWSPTGRELYYESLDNKLMVVSLTMGADTVRVSAPRELFGLPEAQSGAGSPPYNIAPDGRRVLVQLRGWTAQPLQAITNWRALTESQGGGR